MTVCVDELRPCARTGRWRWPVSCHLVVDDGNLGWLHEFAGMLGLRRSWFQGDADLPHYDLTEAKRKRAVALGALEIDRYQLVALIRQARELRQGLEAGWGWPGGRRMEATR